MLTNDGESGIRKDEVRLEEYRQLRMELLQQKQARESSLLYAGVVFFLGFSFLGAFKYAGARDVVRAFFCPVLMASVAFFLFTHVHSAFTICRLAVYIELHVEPSLPGLGWTTIHRRPHAVGGVLSPSTFRLIVALYFASLISLIWVFYLATQPLAIFAVVPMVGLTAFSVVMIKPLIRYAEYRRELTNAWRP